MPKYVITVPRAWQRRAGQSVVVTCICPDDPTKKIGRIAARQLVRFTWAKYYLLLNFTKYETELSVQQAYTLLAEHGLKLSRAEVARVLVELVYKHFVTQGWRVSDAGKQWVQTLAMLA